MDKDFLGFDNDFLGIVDLNLIQFKDGVTHDIWLPLQAADSGEIHLRIIFEKRWVCFWKFWSFEVSFFLQHSMTVKI
jgi:hypothetical protein